MEVEVATQINFSVHGGLQLHCFLAIESDDLILHISLCFAAFFMHFSTFQAEMSTQLGLVCLPQEAMLQGKEVPFSSDVENTAVELLQHLQINRTVGHLSRVPRLSPFWTVIDCNIAA